MNEYIKVIDDNPQYIKPLVHNNWFKLVYPNSQIDISFNQAMNKRVEIRTITGVLHGELQGFLENPVNRIIQSAVLNTDNFRYNTLANKYNHVVMVRPSGSIMSYPATCKTDEEIFEQTNLRIVDRVFCEGIPLDNVDANIAVIENSFQAESFWLNYLGRLFPDGSIRLVNYFGTLTDQEIKRNLQGIEYITFSTTFTNFEWFERLIKFIKPHHKVIGYCHDPFKWVQAQKMYPDTNIVSKEDLN